MIPNDFDVLSDSRGGHAVARPRSLVSVTVTSFNYGHFLPGCLTAVADQTHEELELLIVDDASSDASADIAKEWTERHAERFWRARVVRHRRNQGLSQARNT